MKRTASIILAVALLVVASAASAQGDSADQPAPAYTLDGFYRVLNAETLAGALFTLGGAALTVAMAVWGGFKIAKQTMNSIMNSMDGAGGHFPRLTIEEEAAIDRLNMMDKARRKHRRRHPHKYR